MQKITLNEQRLHDKQATRFFTLLFDLGGGGHLLPTAEGQTTHFWICTETLQAGHKTTLFLWIFNSYRFSQTSSYEIAFLGEGCTLQS